MEMHGICSHVTNNATIDSATTTSTKKFNVALVCTCGLFNDADKLSGDMLSSDRMFSKAKLPWLY